MKSRSAMLLFVTAIIANTNFLMGQVANPTIPNNVCPKGEPMVIEWNLPGDMGTIQYYAYDGYECKIKDGTDPDGTDPIECECGGTSSGLTLVYDRRLDAGEMGCEWSPALEQCVRLTDPSFSILQEFSAQNARIKLEDQFDVLFDDLIVEVQDNISDKKRLFVCMAAFGKSNARGFLAAYEITDQMDDDDYQSDGKGSLVLDFERGLMVTYELKIEFGERKVRKTFRFPVYGISGLLKKVEKTTTASKSN